MIDAENRVFQRNRRIADVADHSLGRLDWAEGAPTRVVSGRTGVRAKAAFPLRARNSLQSLKWPSRCAVPAARSLPPDWGPDDIYGLEDFGKYSPSVRSFEERFAPFLKLRQRSSRETCPVRGMSQGRPRRARNGQ